MPRGGKASDNEGEAGTLMKRMNQNLHRKRPKSAGDGVFNRFRSGRDEMEIQLRFIPEGPHWYAKRLGVIGQNNLENYHKPRSLPTWVDRSYVVRPYMRSTLSAKSAYQTEPPDTEV